MLLIASSYLGGCWEGEHFRRKSISAALVIMESTIFQASVYIKHPGHFPIMREELCQAQQSSELTDMWLVAKVSIESYYKEFLFFIELLIINHKF